MIILLIFAFISGLVTILAPCIWPLLPIILSSATTGGKNKPLGITIGICLSFAIFTLSISYFVKLFHLDPDVLRFMAVAIIGFLGLSLIVPAMSAKLESIVSKFSGKFGQGSSTRNGFIGGLITGFALGIVWSPCAGPILATIATLAATASVNIQVILVTIAYVTGVGIPLFLLSKASNTIFAKTRGINKYTGRIQQLFGVVMILTAIAILTSFDKTLQLKLLEVFPQYSNYLTQLESNPTVKNQLDSLKKKNNMPLTMLGKPVSVGNNGALPDFGPAPEFEGGTKWLNVQNGLTWNDLKGKVVLVDFWTYSCINCIRSLPYLTSWYEKYRGQGFTVVGVHSPEFEFEKKTDNVVSQGVDRFGIKYPVVQDNDFSIWNAYSNDSWPAEYLVDSNGHVRKIDKGEGSYHEMEMAIKSLLAEAGKKTDATIAADKIIEKTPTGQISPETYVGSERMQFLFPDGGVPSGKKNFVLNANPPLNSFSLGGNWTIGEKYSLASEGASLSYHFSAKDVYVIFLPGKLPGKVRVLVDGQETGTMGDVHNGLVTVDADRLYTVVSLPKVEEHTLELQFVDPGISMYTLTFGQY